MSKLKNDNDSCCICLEKLTDTDARFVSECNHTFHFKCIKIYSGDTCPLCRNIWNQAPGIPDKPIITNNNNTNTTNNTNVVTIRGLIRTKLQQEIKFMPKLKIKLVADYDFQTINAHNMKMLIKVVAEESNNIIPEQYKYCHLITILDCSGSMSGIKLHQMQSSMKMLVNELLPQDYLTIITFNNKAQIVFDGKIEDKYLDVNGIIQNIRSDGGTNLGLALLTAINNNNYNNNNNNYNNNIAILFLTDGKDSCEPTNEERTVLKKNIGFPVYTLGYGNDHDSRVLQNLATINQGSFSFISDINTLPDTLASCLGRILSPSLNNIKLIIEHNSIIKINVNTNYIANYTEGKIEIDLLSMQEQEIRDILLSIDLPAGMDDIEFKAILISTNNTVTENIIINRNNTEIITEINTDKCIRSYENICKSTGI